jgi:hypothetical protein
VDKTADQVVAAELAAVSTARHTESLCDVAKGFLQNALRDGPVEVDVLKAGAAALNIGWSTVEKAKKDLDIKSAKSGFAKGDPWTWKLPNAVGRTETA